MVGKLISFIRIQIKINFAFAFSFDSPTFNGRNQRTKFPANESPASTEDNGKLFFFFSFHEIE